MTEKKLTRREREKLTRRGDILRAAIELFSSKGYHNVSMHEIARKAEFAIGTLYRFFRNKEDLYKTLMTAKANEYHEALKDALNAQGDVITILRDYVAAKSEIFAKNVTTLRLYFAETRGAGFNIRAGLDQDIRRLYQDLINRLAELFEQGIREKVFRKLSPYYMAVGLEGITNAFLLCWVENPSRHPYEDNVEMIADMFLNGVAAKGEQDGCPAKFEAAVT